MRFLFLSCIRLFFVDSIFIVIQLPGFFKRHLSPKTLKSLEKTPERVIIFITPFVIPGEGIAPAGIGAQKSLISSCAIPSEAGGENP